MLLIAEPEDRGFLSTPYIYASPDLRHEAEPIKLAMQEGGRHLCKGDEGLLDRHQEI